VKPDPGNLPLRNTRRGEGRVPPMGLCLAVLMLVSAPGQAQTAAGSAAQPVAYLMPGSPVSVEELETAVARGMPSGGVYVPQPRMPMVRLWDEVGGARILPDQGSISITTTSQNLR